MKIWLALFASLLIVACSSNTAGLRIDGQSQTVLFGDKVLSGQLDIVDISTAQVDDRARAVVQLANTTTSDLNIEYRFYWYDSEGLEVNTRLAPWKQKIIAGQETVSISEVTVNPNGEQFRVQIRRAQ